MTGKLIDLDEIRRIKTNGSAKEVSSALESLLVDHMKLMNHLRELRMAECAIHISEAQREEIEQAADEVLSVMEDLQAAIRVLQ